VTSTSVGLQLSGTAETIADTNMGQLFLQDVPFQGPTALTGFNSFSDPPCEVESIDISSGAPDTVALVTSVIVTNPSSITASMGGVMLELWSDDSLGEEYSVKLGSVTVDDFALVPGENYFSGVEGVYQTPLNSPQAGVDFLSNYMSGFNQRVLLKGAADGSSTNIDLLKEALAAFNSATELEGLKDPLVIYAVLQFPPFWDLFNVPTTMTIRNPFAAEIRLVGASLQLFVCNSYASSSSCASYGNQPIGTFTNDVIDFTVGPNEVFVAPTHKANLNGISLDVLRALWDAGVGSGALVRATGNIDVQIGGFEERLYYETTDVPACLENIFGTNC